MFLFVLLGYRSCFSLDEKVSTMKWLGRGEQVWSITGHELAEGIYLTRVTFGNRSGSARFTVVE